MKFKILAITILLSLISIGCNESEDIKIDKQIWMSKNLNVIKFNNGDLIKEAKTKSEWIDALKNGTPAWCYSDNDINNGENTAYYIIGLL